ncbi:BRF1-domain-containing protein [Metschnikowia bicuspidata var. bicuspidata NRRL YB-4993]|uniref:B-related factor 1 n=1 Tax=Metschnikowia bicuspidata var. bicuspidata NRRL YB-4993 TaxID=869754 RepID=A0A1A0HBZ3_9ASCO|nr:BRF1-domain-containing protein [Metschnikowia bicuspidata var. bicuspidata NRRL YB-4993]OBA21531.1 BRF1-domain-containing protein [Metschnikowia bicuspidata var. bicuspidata NRRL YB-4993]
MSKLAAAKPCAGCGHTEFTRDFLATAGDILCLQCGMVQIENPIVSEVQFGESSSGAATVQGAMVGADQARVYNMRNSLESREQTLMNARQKIKLLAAAMRIPEYIHESAHGWFKLALVQNFVQGRRSQNVIAACLYVACRHEKTPHLLIDFSSRLQISVYSLGATYLKLVRALQIQRLPLADPSLFIQHFAERLDFAEHTAKVCRDATKIAQRMSSDWIYEGRRPAGIAGACLLLAARMNNFRRSHSEIVAVARVGEETLQKRLNEFKNTSSALLSVLAFRESAPTHDSQPPSFHKNRSIESKIEELLRQRSRTLQNGVGLCGGQKAEEREARNDELLKAVLLGGDIKEEDLEIALDRILQGQKKTLDISLYRTPAQIQNEEDLRKQIDLNRPRNLVPNNPTTSQILAKVRDEEIINTDDEDEEVLNIKLNDEEKQQKERIWIALNHDFLIAQEKKRLKIEADELTGNTSGQPRKRRKIKDADSLLDDAAVANAINLIGEGGRTISPAENAKQMLQKKSFSRKINYSSIGDLFNE